jgi:hypothetical protein
MAIVTYSRWVVFIPAGFIVSLIPPALLGIFWTFTFGANPESIGIVLSVNFFHGILFVIIGCAISPPEDKKIPAIILVVAAILLSILVTYSNFSDYHNSELVDFLEPVAVVAGSFAGAYQTLD